MATRVRKRRPLAFERFAVQQLVRTTSSVPCQLHRPRVSDDVRYDGHHDVHHDVHVETRSRSLSHSRGTRRSNRRDNRRNNNWTANSSTGSRDPTNGSDAPSAGAPGGDDDGSARFVATLRPRQPWDQALNCQPVQPVLIRSGSPIPRTQQFQQTNASIAWCIPFLRSERRALVVGVTAHLSSTRRVKAPMPDELSMNVVVGA